MLLLEEIEKPAIWPPTAVSFLEACGDYYKSRWPNSDPLWYEKDNEIQLLFDPPDRHSLREFKWGTWCQSKGVAESGDRHAIAIRETGEVIHKLVSYPANGESWNELLSFNFFRIWVPEEIGEILRWLEASKVNLKPFDFIEVPFTSILEDVYFLVESTEQRPSLATFQQLSEIHDHEVIERAVIHAFDYLDAAGAFHSGRHPLFDQGRRDDSRVDRLTSVSGRTLCLRENDLIVAITGEVVTARAFNTLSNYALDALKIVLRPNYRKISLPFLLDYFIRIAQGKSYLGWLGRMIATWRDSANIRYLRIPIPEQQARFSIELRIERQNLIDCILGDGPTYDSIETIIEDTRKRIDCWEQVLKSSLLYEADWLNCPLPYFLAWPFYHFRKSVDNHEEIRLGKILLNLSCKTLVFLRLQYLKSLMENEHHGSLCNSKTPIDLDVLEDAITQVESELLGRKPPSDGRLLGLARDLNRAIEASGIGPDCSKSIFPWANSSGIKRDEDVATQKALDELVNLRNRLQHPPFDETAFISGCRNAFPLIVKNFRNYFQTIVIFSPLAMRNICGKNVVSALKIAGYDGRFQNFDFETEHGIERFPENELQAKCLSSNVFSLGRYFTLKVSSGGLYDVGVFDHVRDGKPVYHFIREFH